MEFLASEADFTRTFWKALTQAGKPAAPSRSLSLPDNSPVLFQNSSSGRLFTDDDSLHFAILAYSLIRFSA